jgi:purine nucleoside permease
MKILFGAAIGAVFLSITGAAPAGAAVPDGSIRPKFVVLTTFGEAGNEARAGELGDWVAREHLTKTIAVPGVLAPMYYDDTGLFVMVTGTCNRSGLALMALGLDRRFDLSHTYWMIAGIAGADADRASVGSAAWAQWVVDADNVNEVDDHDAPADWPYGILPYGSHAPDQPPGKGDWSQKPMVFQLDPKFVHWAYALTKNVVLRDPPSVQKFAASYVGQPTAQRAPFVLLGDALGTARYWHGPVLTRWAEHWVSMYTKGEGNFVMTDCEDQSIAYALYLLEKASRVDSRRLLVLRTASNYSAPPHGESVVHSLLTGESAGSALAADSDYRVGAPVAHAVIKGWARYRDTIPGN